LPDAAAAGSAILALLLAIAGGDGSTLAVLVLCADGSEGRACPLVKYTVVVLKSRNVVVSPLD
jgi:hypothetical protein